MKTADYTVHKPASWWVIHVMSNHLKTYKYLSNGRKCHNTQHLQNAWNPPPPPKEEGETNRGKVGVFIQVTVLKDVGDAVNLTYLLTSCAKNVYCTSGPRPSWAELHTVLYVCFFQSIISQDRQKCDDHHDVLKDKAGDIPIKTRKRPKPTMNLYVVVYFDSGPVHTCC